VSGLVILTQYLLCSMVRDQKVTRLRLIRPTEESKIERSRHAVPRLEAALSINFDSQPRSTISYCLNLRVSPNICKPHVCICHPRIFNSTKLSCEVHTNACG
jgi:hypothetical protein